MVGEGAGASTPFMARAVEERLANPTEPGLERKTVYTFFYDASKNVRSEMRVWSGEATYQEGIADNPSGGIGSAANLEDSTNAVVVVDLLELEVCGGNGPAVRA